MLLHSEGIATAAPAAEIAADLIAEGFGPYFGTPCGVLGPLYEVLQRRAGLLTVPREDNAVGIAVGAALAGRHPVVLMQNSGLGQSVNAIASLVTPYRIPLLFVVSLRGVEPDTTQENATMGRLTEPLLAALDVPTALLQSGHGLAAEIRWARRMVRDTRTAAALLVPPVLFGWRA
jgi:sulfopyruvate decarboxylase subunit alpha